MRSDDRDGGSSPSLQRRRVLQGLGAALATVPFGALGCGDGAETATSGSGGSAGTGGSAGAGASGGAGGATGSGGTGGVTTTGTGSTTTGWAEGGTESMSGEYEDPFTEPLGAACAMFCATTKGPCYAETLIRKDVSEGYPGLPVRLALLVVDETCTPVPNATVDIWHTRNTGIYSGPDAIAFCTTDDPDAKTHKYFRGVQSTDAKGRVDFDTCYPGWYPGRAVHVHFTVRVAGEEHVTSQLYFTPDLTVDVFTTHPDYEAHGLPDTANATDGIYPGEEAVMSAAKQADGALLAWKVVVIRSSLATPLCN